MSPPYLPICGISMPFQANLYVPSLNLQNKFSLLCACTAHETVGSIQYFSMLGGLFSRYVLIHYHSRESGWYSGCPVPCSKIKSKYNKTKLPQDCVCMDGTRGFGSPWSVIDWWRGSKNFTILFGNRL